MCDKALSFYEETMRIPLIVKPDHAVKEKRSALFAQTCDIYSTILEYAGVEREKAQRDGLSLVPILKSENPLWRETVACECTGLADALTTQRMIRKGAFKYAFNLGDTDELYDLDSDPHELNNLASNSEYKDKRAEMQEELAAWMEANEDPFAHSYRHLLELKN
jgi:arylsulfatase A-like enzyme